MCKKCEEHVTGNLPRNSIKDIINRIPKYSGAAATSRASTPLERKDNAVARLRSVGAMIEGLHYANPEHNISRYADVLKNVSDYIFQQFVDADRMRIELHETAMKLMKQEAKLSGLRIALTHTQNYAKSAIKQKKAAAEKTVASLGKFVADELKKSELEE